VKPPNEEIFDFIRRLRTIKFNRETNMNAALQLSYRWMDAKQAEEYLIAYDLEAK